MTAPDVSVVIISFNDASRLPRAIRSVQRQTLRNLERDGRVARTIVCDRPIAVSYALTPMGADLLPIIAAMKAWTQQHFLEVERQNLRYDAETAPGPPAANRRAR